MEEFRKNKEKAVKAESLGQKEEKKRKLEIDGKKMIIFSEILKPKFDE